MKKMLVLFILLTVPSVLYAKFDAKRLPVAPCAAVSSTEVAETHTVPIGQTLAETQLAVPQTVSPNPIEKPELDDREAALLEREQKVTEREKAVATREAALTDWYGKLSIYREYLNGIVSSVGRASQPVYATYSRGVSVGCANGRCGW